MKRVLLIAAASTVLLSACPTVAAPAGYNDHTTLEADLLLQWNAGASGKGLPQTTSVRCIKSGQTMNCRFELAGPPDYSLATYIVSEDGQTFFGQK